MQIVTSNIIDDIAVIRIDDGKANVMSSEVLHAVRHALVAAAEIASVTLVIGRTGIFSAGFDLNTLRSGIDASRAMLADGVELILQMLVHPHPLVAACTGHAFPMGAFLLLGADVRVGAAGAWKIGLNEVAIGIDVPNFALDLAASRLQPSGWHAIATGRMFSPVEAIAAGYLDVVVDPDRVEPHSIAVAQQLKALDRAATRSTRLRMRAPIASKIRQHLQDLRAVAN